MKLTKHTAIGLSLSDGERDRFEWDDDMPGFGVRLRRSTDHTSVTWVVQGRVKGATRRESLGDVRKITLEDARKAARRWFAKLELGVDPAAQRNEAKAHAAIAKLTLAAVAERYLEAKRRDHRQSTHSQATMHLTRFWKPLGGKPLDAIKRADVATTLQELIKAHGRTAAARARSNLSALFTWSMGEGLCDSNPVANTNDPAEGIPARDRVLSDDEIRGIWYACRDDDFGRIIRLLLLTGCRRGEIAGLRWSEISFASDVLTLPPARTKNNREHSLTLPQLAMDILRAAPRRADRGHVFGGGKDGFNAFSYGAIALNGRISAAEGKALAPWTLHDLRRTFRTGLGKLGVAPHVAELAINHVRGGVEAIYDRHKYQREITAALALWADHVNSIITGSDRKVVALRTA